MRMYKYVKFVVLWAVLAVFTACNLEEQTEFNLPGEWYTSEAIDFGAYTWGRGTVMTFNNRNQGTIGSWGDPDYLMFRWGWVSGSYNLMELEFYDDGSFAYIWGAEADSDTFTGTWYNSWEEYQDDVNGQPFRMRRR